MIEIQNSKQNYFGHLEFGIWNLSGIWDSYFGILPA
jgi:hypothetical protein